MAVNKNFVVKNGIEVNTNLIVADTDSNKVGIGTTVPEYTLHVFEGTGIGASMVYVTGISTSLEEFNVGVGGTTFTAISNAGAGIAGSVGVGTDLPGYLLEVHAPVSTGQTALYVKGDMHVTGDINLDDITLNELKVTGISTFEDSIFVGSGATVGLNTVHFTDHAKAMFGDGDDLQIYHDGNSRVRHTGAGDLLLQSNSDVYIQRASDGHQMIIAENDGPVKLYYDNTQRLTTTSSGVDVTATFNSTGITTLASAGGISTTGGDLYIGGDLFVSDNITLDTNLNILGIATIATLRVSDTATGESGTEALIVGTGLSVRGSSTGVAVTLAGAGGITTTGGDFYVGGDLYISEDVILDTNLEIIGIATIGTLQVSSTSGINTILSTVESTSKDTGSLVLEGGLGVEKQLYVGAGASVGTALTIGTGIGVTTILDDDAFSNASATALASQQSIKAYVDAQITAEDLDFAGDSGTGAVDLDSQSLTIAGTANEIETSASNQTLTIGLPNFVTVSNGLNVTGNGSTTTTLNVSGISTFSEDILIGTAATVGFGSTAFFRDGARAIFGTGEDLKIYHDGDDSLIEEVGTGRLNIRTNGDSIKLQNTNGGSAEAMGVFNSNGSADLYYDGTKKFETGPAGTITVGVSTADGFDVGDNEYITAGIGSDLAIYHDSSHSHIVSKTGNLRILADGTGSLVLTAKAGEESITCAQDGAVAIKHDNSNKLVTTSSGVIVTGIATAGAGRFTSNLTPLDGQGLEIFCPDTSSAQIQAYDRANTEHDKLIIKGNPTEIYDSATKRIETTTSGVINTGITTFSSTAHITIPVGTTGDRDGNAANGMIRYNTTLNSYEGYGNGAWGGLGGGTEIDTAVSSTSATNLTTFAHASYRSASMRIQITQGSSYQVGRYLLIHDGTTVTIVEESAIATGDMLGSISGAINGSNVEVKVTMNSASSATVTTIIDKITV